MVDCVEKIDIDILNLSCSIEFYVALPGFRLAARWETGAYLSHGDLWLCLSLDESRVAEKQPDYTHYTFSVGQDDFEDVTAYTNPQLPIGVLSESAESTQSTINEWGSS
ncbi:glutathione transferase [Pseudomonas sp. GM48]|uniref:glutathione transferase n=1 Tax=Pseudomonas sp. GM48 TaxID=1144330 RepID=UPI001EE6444F|nr:glutathione transferase [Pseudomonas sp. GM48]